MGFCYLGYGNIHPCGVKDTKVFYKLPSGKVITHNSVIEEDIPEQTNLFISNTVMFMLRHNGNMYLGRRDGSVSIYRETDGLLVGLRNWVPPWGDHTKVCGYYSDGIDVCQVKIDTRDMQTVYIVGRYAEGVINNMPDEVNESHGLVGAMKSRQKETYIVGEDGELYGIDAWSIQNDLRIQNCPIFL